MRLILVAWMLALMARSAACGVVELDDSAAVLELFQRGQAAQQAGDWQQARQIFLDLTTRFSESRHQDLFLYEHAKSTYHAGQVTDARAGFDLLLSRYPDTRMAPYAVYYWANCALAGPDSAASATEYVRAWRLSQDARLDQLIIDGLMVVPPAALAEAISGDALSPLSEDRRCALLRELSARLVARQRVGEAARILQPCESGLARQSTGSDTLPSLLKVAVMVPLSGEYQRFGEELLNGVMLGVKADRTASRRFAITPYDTQSDPIMAGRIATELARLEYDAIIGPLTTTEAAVASAALACYQVPVVIPAATGSGITLLSDQVFQLSPNIELQGVQLAEYAQRNLTADTAVILTPTGVDYLQIAQAFAQRFERLGGTILGVEYYRSSDRDFGQYIQSVKSMLLEGIDKSAVYLDAYGDTLEADAIPARVDCIFLPGPTDQLRLLAPQIRFYNLQGRLLGSDGWGSEEIYSLGEDVCGGALFTSPFVYDSEEHDAFTRGYTSAYGEAPTRLASLGHDAVIVLASALARSHATRKAWLDELASTSNFVGAAGRITFGQYRENIELPLYRIEAGKPVLVGLGRGETTPITEP